MILWLLLLSFSCRDSLSLVGVAIRCVKMVCVFAYLVHFLGCKHDATECFCSCIYSIHSLTHFLLFCAIFNIFLNDFMVVFVLVV